MWLRASACRPLIPQSLTLTLTLSQSVALLSLFLVLSLSPLLVASPRCWPCIIAFADVASLFFVAAVRGVAVVVFVVAAVVPLGRYVYGLVWRGAA